MEVQEEPEITTHTAAPAKAAAQILINTHNCTALIQQEVERLQEEENIDLQEQRRERTALPIQRTMHAGGKRVPYIKMGFQAVGSIPAMMCSAMTDSGATKSLITEGHL